jgi:hypothetical protein
MSTLVTARFFARPGCGDEAAGPLLEILGESLKYDGCETIRTLGDQDDADHVTGLTQWTNATTTPTTSPGVPSAASCHLRGHADPAPRHPLLRRGLLRPGHRDAPWAVIVP